MLGENLNVMLTFGFLKLVVENYLFCVSDNMVVGIKTCTVTFCLIYKENCVLLWCLIAYGALLHSTSSEF